MPVVHRNRVSWVDQLRGFAFLCVIISHFQSQPGLGKLICSFHMPLFFILSGYFLNVEKIKRESLLSQICHKLQSLMIPYFWMNFLTLPMWILNFKLVKHSKTTLVALLKGIFVSQNKMYPAPTNPAWFIGALFFANVYIILIVKLAHKSEMIRLLLVLACGCMGFLLCKYHLPYHINTALVGAFYLYMGYLAKKYILDSEEKWGNYRQLIVVVLLIIGAACAYQNEWTCMVYGEYYNIALFLGGSLGISLALLLMFQIFPDDYFFSYMGQNTLLCLGIHIRFVRLLEALFPTITSQPNICMLLALLLFVVLGGICKICNRYCPYINGKYSIHEKSVLAFFTKYIMVTWCLMVPVYVIMQKLHLFTILSPIIAIIVMGIILLTVSVVITYITHKWVIWIYLERKEV